MNTLPISKHAEVRASQRSLPLADLDILMWIGCEVRDGFFVRDVDCETIEEQLLDILKRVRKLRGARLVVAGGRAVTAYRPGRRREKQLLRGAEEREKNLS